MGERIGQRVSMSALAWIALAGAVVFALVLIFQYPIGTSFPIGGDATRYVERAHEVLRDPPKLFTNSHYPGAIAVFTASRLVPLSWPDRFVWWMVLGQIATTVAVGFLLYRMSGWRAASAAIAIWPLTIVTVNYFIEDGILAQLWSMPLLLLGLERLYTRSFWGAVGAFVGMTLVHLLTAGIFALGAALFVILDFPRSTPRSPKGIALFIVALLSGGGLLLFMGDTIVAAVMREWPTDTSSAAVDVVRSLFTPFLLFAVIGFVRMLERTRDYSFVLTLVGLAFMSLLLTSNNLLGVGVITKRFLPYFTLHTVVFAALGLPYVIRHAFGHPIARSLFAVMLIATSGLFAWSAGAQTYDFYESDVNYARLHPDERATMEWIKHNTQKNAIIVSTNANRHSEWGPFLSNRTWYNLEGADAFWNTRGDALRELVADRGYTHLVFFRHREDVPVRFRGLPVLFKTDGAIVYNLTEL